MKLLFLVIFLFCFGQNTNDLQSTDNIRFPIVLQDDQFSDHRITIWMNGDYIDDRGIGQPRFSGNAKYKISACRFVVFKNTPTPGTPDHKLSVNLDGCVHTGISIIQREVQGVIFTYTIVDTVQN